MVRATVVVTNHNYARFLVAAVDSALAQIEPCRVVVVDDGSTDDSVSVLRDHLDERLGTGWDAANQEKSQGTDQGTADSAGHGSTEGTGQVVVVAQPNGGQASAVNAGWAHVVGDTVLFLDADDVLAPTAVAEVRRALGCDRDLESGRAAADDGAEAPVMCVFRLGWIDGSGDRLEGGFPEPDRPLPSGDLSARLAEAPDDISWQPMSGNGFRADMLADILPMPEEGYRISADHYLSNVSAVYGPVAAVEAELGHYRIHGDNADHRARFDLGRVREILARTTETRQWLIDHGGGRGLAMPSDPDGFVSLTTSALRLISSRFDAHPYPGDERRDLVAAVDRAIAARPHFGPARSLTARAWARAVAYGPAGLVPRLADAVLTR